MIFDLFLVIGTSILISVVGHKLFEKTGLPESIFMIILGLLAGPLLNIVDVEELTRIVPFLFILSLIIILLESGLSTKIFEIAKTTPIALIFTLIVFITTTLACGTFLCCILGWSLLQSMLLAVICTGTATLPVTYLLSKISVREEVKHLLVLESIINDVTIITAVTLILQAATLAIDLKTTLGHIARYVVIAIFYGSISSPIWAYALVRFFKEPKLIYISTLAVATILYALAEASNGSGIIAILTFSLFLGNLLDVIKASRIQETPTFVNTLPKQLESLKVTQTEIAFLAKNFFFFILGALFKIDVLSTFIFLVCLTLVVLMVITRFISSKIISSLDEKYKGQSTVISLMLPRGFTAILAAFMPMEKNVDAPLLREMVLLIVVITTIVATLGPFVMKWLRRARAQKEP